MKLYTILGQLIFLLLMITLYIGCQGEEEMPIDDPPGFIIEGSYFNDTSPMFAIDPLDEEIKVTADDVSCTPISDNEVRISIKNVTLTDEDYNYEMFDMSVAERSNGRWIIDPDFSDSFADVTEASIVLAMQSSESGNDPNSADEILELIKDCAKKLLPNLISSKVNFRLALIEYADDVALLHDFSNDFFNESIKNEFDAAITEIELKPDELKNLAGALDLSVDILAPQEADYKAIFIIGDGRDNEGSVDREDVKNYMRANNITNVFCVGASKDPNNLPGDGEYIFEELASMGDGFLKISTYETNVIEVYDSCYKHIPNVYDLEYIRALNASESVELQWSLSVQTKE